eukprot:jgi/Mesvir1/404/Mv11296-RA.1
MVSRGGGKGAVIAVDSGSDDDDEVSMDEEDDDEDDEGRRGNKANKSKPRASKAKALTRVPTQGKRAVRADKQALEQDEKTAGQDTKCVKGQDKGPKQDEVEDDGLDDKDDKTPGRHGARPQGGERQPWASPCQGKPPAGPPGSALRKAALSPGGEERPSALHAMMKMGKGAGGKAGGGVSGAGGKAGASLEGGKKEGGADAATPARTSSPCIDGPGRASQSPASGPGGGSTSQAGGAAGSSGHGGGVDEGTCHVALTQLGCEDRFATRFSDPKYFFYTRNVRDAQKRAPGDEGYDPRTLYVPPAFLKELSPGQRQWWDFKAKYFDHVFLFKVGKFYEMYEMDAIVGGRELSLEFMKGDQPHCGFPEKNYTKNAEILARKGYRVLVVEQTETPQQLEERNRASGGSKDKVVRREVVAALTKGTLVDGDMLAASPDASYLLAITETLPEADDAPTTCAGTASSSSPTPTPLSSPSSGAQPHDSRAVIGVCFVDTGTSRFLLGQFEDDEFRTHLRSLLAQLRPVEVVRPRGMLSPATTRALRNGLRNPLWTDLLPGAEFWSPARTRQELAKGGYFTLPSGGEAADNSDDGGNGKEAAPAGEACWPKNLRTILAAGEGGAQALSALGGCVCYLRRALLDKELLGVGRLELLPREQPGGIVGDMGAGDRETPAGPDDSTPSLESSGLLRSHDPHSLEAQPFLELDGSALENLEVLENNSDGGSAGSLLGVLDRTATPFGRRLLRSWLSRPLRDIAGISARQDAVADLKGVAQDALQESRKHLSRVVDVERMLSRLHANCSSGGGSGRNASSVVLYEDASRKRLTEFVSTLQGCRALLAALRCFEGCSDELTSEMLRDIITPGRRCPSTLDAKLQHFQDGFDWAEAVKEGRIIPSAAGMDEDFDAAQAEISRIEAELNEFLKTQRKALGGSSEVTYVTVGKDRYLIEVPDERCSRVPGNWQQCGQKKNYRRFRAPFVAEQLSALADAEEAREGCLKGIFNALVRRFVEDYAGWSALVRCVADLDALSSLAIASITNDGPMCRPEFGLPDDAFDASNHDNSRAENQNGGPATAAHCQRRRTGPWLEVRRLRHPCASSLSLSSGVSFVPNDTVLGGRVDVGEEATAEGKGERGEGEGEGQLAPPLIILTGPNMGGKSTLLRQVSLAVILAQIGADVPAESFSLSPVDRLFVRMGARDNIIAGQSTFLLELAETSAMLSRATRHSLVALDELGRGTSTSDGAAIAHAVVHHLCEVIGCRGLFSTHYHTLADEHAHNPKVALAHMGCHVSAARLPDEEGGAAASSPSGQKGGEASAGEAGDATPIEQVTFLYTLTPGACPKSYGVNCALLAGMPPPVVRRAAHKAEELLRGVTLPGPRPAKRARVTGDSGSLLPSEAANELLPSTATAWSRSQGGDAAGTDGTITSPTADAPPVRRALDVYAAIGDWLARQLATSGDEAGEDASMVEGDDASVRELWAQLVADRAAPMVT